jgi:hypothetical protein
MSEKRLKKRKKKRTAEDPDDDSSKSDNDPDNLESKEKPEEVSNLKYFPNLTLSSNKT